jgi:pyruvate dehydrogenase E2 component (dihydrolipoamide acetyltransferase)
MAKEILMPKQGMTVESCFLSVWHVKENDEVKEGTILFSYETDKAVFDYVAEDEGTVLKLLYSEGDIVDVLKPVCIIGEKGESIESYQSDSKEETKIKTDNHIKEDIEPTQIITEKQIKRALDDKIYASPRAKRLAQKQNVDLNNVQGSGPNGRIIEIDVLNQHSLLDKNNQPITKHDALSYQTKPLSNMRKIIGKTMMRSLQNSAQLTHTLSFDMTDIINYRKHLKDLQEKNEIPKITINDIIVYAVSRVLKSHQDLNAHFENNELKIFDHVHMGIATDTPRGLMVPTLRSADQLTLVQISNEAKALFQQAIAGSINPDLLTNASFTISNLGTLDIEHFTPIINPPQTGILGVNTMTTRMKMDEYGRVLFYQALSLSLTYDHQVLDGAQASRFLKSLKEYLENFSNRIEEDKMGLK